MFILFNKEYNRFNLQKLITTFRKEKPFLNEVDKFALQNACKNLANGFKNYFQKRAGFPIYKSKKNSKRTVSLIDFRTSTISKLTLS